MPRTLLDALEKIAAYPRGGVVVSGAPSGDRDEMIEIARNAIREHLKNKTATPSPTVAKSVAKRGK